MPVPETPEIAPDLLSRIPMLATGQHGGSGDAMCAMEAVAYLAGEPVSDEPACASRIIAAFLRVWNDGLPQTERASLIRPLLTRIVGTNAPEAVERRRVGKVVDWLVRTHLPAWFRLAKLNVEADAVADHPEIRDVADLATLCDHLTHARRRAAIGNLALRQTGPAVRAAAWDATHRAAWAAVQVALEEAGTPILTAGWNASYAAAYAAARASGKASLEPTRLALQASAAALVERLIETGSTADFT